MISTDPAFPYDVEKTKWPWRHASGTLPTAWERAALPKISVITPSYNQGKYIEETIRSVLLQDYPNLEFIIMDGGSTDNTLEIIKKYEPWLAYWESVPDRGQSHAINKGLQKATGDWIAWLNADDLYLENALPLIASAIVRSPEPVFWIVGATIFTDPDLHEISQFPPHLYTSPGRDRNYIPTGWIDFVCTKRSGIALPQPSSFWKRDIVIEVGGIDETLKYAMDHELYGRLAYHGFRPVLIGQALACFRMHSAQKTVNFPIVFWEEELEIVRHWMRRVEGDEKQRLESYALWLERYIKNYPVRSFYHGIRTRLGVLLKTRFTPIYNWMKRQFEKKA
ncbi:MAG: glycosyltransferase [Chloroflexi bacterium]|nr:glycosyltransferase [Chloroflexota bacterium]